MMTNFNIKKYEKLHRVSTIEFLQIHLNKEEFIEYVNKLDNDKLTYLLFNQNQIVGVCFLSENISEYRGKTLDIDIKMEDEFQNYDNFYSLFSEIDSFIRDNKIAFIITSVLSTQLELKDFLHNDNYSQWFSLRKMIHDGRILPNHELIYRHYEENDFDRYFSGLGEAFAPMRTAMDIPPYNVCTSASKELIIKKRDSFLKDSQQMYLFFDLDIYIGAVTISGSEIDDFYVVNGLQGKGYGKKIIEFSINLIKQKSHEPVLLSVVDWNEKAKKLYQSVGFNTLEIKIVYRKTINWE